MGRLLVQMSSLLDKVVKSAVINIAEEWKETVLDEDGYDYRVSVSRQKLFLERTKWRVVGLDLGSTATEFRISLEGFNSPLGGRLGLD